MIFISIMILIVAIALHSLSPVILTRISAIVFIYAGVLSLNALDIQSIGSGIGIYSGLFHVTTVSQLIDTFIFIIGSLILVSWPTFPSNRLIQSKLNSAGEYSLIVLFSTLGASLLISSADLISMYLSIELQSFGVYILSTLYRNSESATSAGLKYFLLGSLSSCLILLGIGLIYSFTGLTNLESIYSLVSVSNSPAAALLHHTAPHTAEQVEGVIASALSISGANINISQGLNLGLIIIIIGFLFKISAAPLHHWAPDVYDDSPTIVTIWLTIMPKISIIIFLLELQTQLGLTENPIETSYGYGGILKNLLLISSLLSLIIGTVVGLAQSKIKRLLSYSTISHVGFILLALAINTEQSIDSLIFYIIQYSLTNLNTFLILIAFGYIIHSTSSPHPSGTVYGKTSAHFVSSTTPSVSGLRSRRRTVFDFEDRGNGAERREGVSVFDSPVFTEGEDGVNFPFGEDSPYSDRRVRRGVVEAPRRLRNEANLNGNKGSELDIKFISELKGQFFSNPLLSISLTICLFSMAGIPPLLGFFSKQFVLYSAIQSGYYFMSIVAIIVSVISASYYLKIIKVLHSHSTPCEGEASYPYTVRGGEASFRMDGPDHNPSRTESSPNGKLTPSSPSVKTGETERIPSFPSTSLLSRSSAATQGSTVQLGEPQDPNGDAAHSGHKVEAPIFSPSVRNGVRIDGKDGGVEGISNFHSFLISTLTLSILLFVLKPSVILNSTQLLSLSLFYY